MSFTPKTGAFSGKINAVTPGTGDNAIVIGGQNVLPFYTFDAPIENAPKIGIEVSDLASQWEVSSLHPGHGKYAENQSENVQKEE